MAHLTQMLFIAGIKARFPKFFKNVDVLEVGSYNINGSCRQYFEGCNYIGIDLAPGKDVDVMCSGKDFKSATQFDTVLSTETFEHDPDWKLTFENMHRLAKPEGLIVFTCAANNRHEHGTIRTTPDDSLVSTDYYCNLNVLDFEERFNLREWFYWYCFEARQDDLYFAGLKKP